MHALPTKERKLLNKIYDLKMRRKEANAHEM